MAAQNFKGPLDYIDVASRIVEFRKKFPEGRLRQGDLQFIDFAGKSWVVYTAEAWRTPDDPCPAQGTAWEPVPGPTQFTRDSEVQNAETAAWGRAMVAALAVDTKKGIASSEEVRNRQAEPPRQTPTQRRDEARDNATVVITGAASAKTPTELDRIEDWAGKNGLTSNTAVVDAITTARTRLGSSDTDSWAVASVPD